MRLSVERLRWVLIAAGVLLVLIVAGFVGYGRYRAYKTFQNILKRNGVTITHETNGFTYSQSVKGKTLFTLHAAKAQQRSDGVWLLHDAELTLYSRTSPRVDHVYGSEFSYDRNADIVRALGEVHMDLQAPEGMTHTQTAPAKIRGKQGRAPSAPRVAEESRETIHVRTSGLVYLRSLGVAATQEDVEFRYGDLEAHSRGAEFEEGESTVHLLADVRVNGQLHGQPVNLHASKADLDRDTNLASLAQPVITTAGRTVSAANGLIHMRKEGSIEAIDAGGGVTMVAGTRQIHAAQLNVKLNDEMAAQHAMLTGGVTLVDTSAVKPMHGSAAAVESTFDAEGQPNVITATGNAAFAMTDRGANGVKLNRTMSGDRIVVNMVPSGTHSKPRVGSVHAAGHAHADGESLVLAGKGKGGGGRKTTSLVADDLLANFSEGERGALVAQHISGHGHTRLQQDEPDHSQQTSTADTLEMQFAAPAPGSGEMLLESATETGHVTIRSQAAAKAGKPGVLSTADAQRAVYEGASETLTLTGAAQLRQPGVEVAAKSVVLDQVTGDASASVDVLASLANKDPKAKREASHVMSDSAKFSHGAQLAEFTSTDAHPAKLWQEGSQILAAKLTLDGVNRNLIARPAAPKGTVSAIFTSAPTASATAPRVLRVSSPAMDYADKSGEAVFTGGVTMHAATGDIRAQRAVVFLKKGTTPAAASTVAASAAPATGQIDRAVLSGDIHLMQPGRSGTGEQLLYTASTDSFVLTGTPARAPHIVDAQQGSISGATLLFGAADSTIIVSGTSGAKSPGGRVRTETTVTQ